MLANALRTFELEKRELNQKDPFKQFLTAIAYAICSTYHTTLQATPGQLVFGQDMILPIRLATDWAIIAKHKQERIDDLHAGVTNTCPWMCLWCIRGCSTVDQVAQLMINC